jgi:hypothetical protein
MYSNVGASAIQLVVFFSLGIRPSHVTDKLLTSDGNGQRTYPAHGTQQRNEKDMLQGERRAHSMETRICLEFGALMGALGVMADITKHILTVRTQF